MTLTRNTDSAVLKKDKAINNAKIKIFEVELYIPQYTPSIANQAVLFKQILSKLPSELQHVERSVFLKELNTQNLWTFQLGTLQGINVPIWIFVGFQEQDREHSQN